MTMLINGGATALGEVTLIFCPNTIGMRAISSGCLIVLPVGELHRN